MQSVTRVFLSVTREPDSPKPQPPNAGSQSTTQPIHPKQRGRHSAPQRAPLPKATAHPSSPPGAGRPPPPAKTLRPISNHLPHCEDRVLDGPASGEKGSKGGPYKYCNPRTCMTYHRLEAVPWLPWLPHTLRAAIWRGIQRSWPTKQRRMAKVTIMQLTYFVRSRDREGPGSRHEGSREGPRGSSRGILRTPSSSSAVDPNASSYHEVASAHLTHSALWTPPYSLISSSAVDPNASSYHEVKHLQQQSRQ